MVEPTADFVEVLRSLGRLDVLVIGELQAEIVRIWSGESEGNLVIVLTGRQRLHYLERHPETAHLEDLLPAAVLDPDEVHRNKKDGAMAIFYKVIDDRKFLRVAILMQEIAGYLKHSVLSYRIAMQEEVMRNGHRRVWVRK